MARRVSLFVAACLALAGCKQDKSVATPAPLDVVVSSSSVSADGTSRVAVRVVSGNAPVTLVASRGHFSTSGSDSVVLTAVPGSADLVTCDARVDASCAGPTEIRAVDASRALGSYLVYFKGFEDCTNGVDDNGDGAVDCADPQCPLDMPCTDTGLSCGPGSGGVRTCSKCSGNGGAPEPAGETSCTDGHDNDCDGLADCADPGCDARLCTMATSAIGACVQGACVCKATEATEKSCGDGQDNDCDGKIDCADPDCARKTCDATRGLVCPGGSVTTCGTCPTGLTAEGAGQCGDGLDNDCDGVFDCDDPDCQPAGSAAGKSCNPYGGTCILTGGVASCGCPSGKRLEDACSGGVDDDCDGKVDCADPDCQPAASGSGPACDTLGRTCTAAGQCACAGTSEICNNYDASGNAIDDDCDGRANCADPDCRPKKPGEAGADCSGQDQYGMACDATGTCACTGNGAAPELKEVSCGDGIDNDCDFLVDCQDPDCSTGTPRSCGPAGAACSATTHTCVCPGGTSESSCNDGVDNDCNGKTDCEEPACAAQACDAANATYLCLSGSCVDPATQYSVAVTPVRPRIPADGKATTVVNVVVKFNGSPKAGADVTFARSPATLGAFTSATAVKTDSLGRASVTFQSAGATGVATITATEVASGATGSATVELPGIGEVRLLASGGIQYPVMGVKTSGYREQNQLLVEVLDQAQRPYPAGLDVTFEHRPLGGSTLSAPVAAPACAAPPCVQSGATTDDSGVARVTLYSGTVAGTVGVTATASTGPVAALVTRVFDLPPIAIVGAKPNAGHFSLVCSPENVPALAGTTCHVSTIDAPFTCVALLKDRYNNLLGRATTVSFMSEAGAVGPPATTPEYDPSGAAASQGELGSALEVVNTLGAKLPKDVSANPGETAVSTPADVCGVSQRSPRDGVVTVVAWTPGEEAFFDADGNGVYTPSVDPFVDLPEPFVDYDDDDVRDPDEPFIDSNGNGVWDPPNGEWDSNTNVWTKTVVVYSGMPASLTLAGREYESRWLEPADAGTYAGSTPLASFSVRPAFNAEKFTDCNGNGRRDTTAFETYTDTDKSGAYELGEPFVDCDGDGIYSSTAVAEAYVDADGNGAYDDKDRPPTSETLDVAAVDRNLNRLAAATKYSASKPEGTNFTISYHGLASLPDRRGVGFGFQPCRSSDPTICALDCADLATALDKRCVMRSRVADFTYGYGSTVTFKGGGAGSAEGAVEAYWHVELFGEILTIPVSGTHQ